MSHHYQPKLETAKSQESATDHFQILIMDTAEHTAILKLACNTAGLSVASVTTIQQAFEFLDETDHVDLIVSAAYLENESVFEFLRRLRADSKHGKSKFMTLALACSVAGKMANISTERAGRSLGADAFVFMPVFDPTQLISEIRKLLPPVARCKIVRENDQKVTDAGSTRERLHEH